MAKGISIVKGRIAIPDQLFATKDPSIKLKGARWGKDEKWRILATPRNIELVNRAFGTSLSAEFKPSIVPAEIRNFPFKTPPYDHQLMAIAEAAGTAGHGYFLASGLGKTWCTINEATILHKQGKLNDVLVICPKSIVSVWAREIKKHGHYEQWEVYAWELGFIHEPKGRPTMRRS